MPNWWIIARKEVEANLRSQRAFLILLASTVLLTISLLLLIGDYQQRKLSYDRRDLTGQTRAGKRPKLTAPPSELIWEQKTGCGLAAFC